MRIGIDLSVLAERRTGIGNYAFCLASALLQLKTDHEWVWFVSDLSPTLPTLGEGVKTVRLPRKHLPFWSTHVSYARIMEKERLDVLHGVANVLPLTWPSATLSRKGRGVKSIITLHDLAIYLHPEWFARGQWLATKIVVPASIRKAQKIIVPSMSTKQDLQELFRVPEEKIAVIAEGVEERFFKSQERPLPSSLPRTSLPLAGTLRGTLPPFGLELMAERSSGESNEEEFKPREGKRGYILFVGTLEPRKNLTRLIEAYGLLPKEIREEYELVIAGKNSPLPSLWQREGVRGSSGIRWLGYVNNDELPQLYQNAALFVYPSLYEGFGLPVLEAMAGGAPTICSKQIVKNFQFPLRPRAQGREAISNFQINSNDENSKISPSPQSPPLKGGESPVVLAVDAYSVEEIRGAMERLLARAELRKEIGGKGIERARQFTWQKTAQKTLEVYESL